MSARHSDPETSHLAAAKAPKLSAIIIRDLLKNGPGNSRTIARRTGIDLVSISPCLKPLKEKEWVTCDTTEIGSRGCLVLVWQASQYAIDMYCESSGW